jgi:hypothetical protein
MVGGTATVGGAKDVAAVGTRGSALDDGLEGGGSEDGSAWGGGPRWGAGAAAEEVAACSGGPAGEGRCRGG